MTFKENIDNKEISELPHLEFKGKIHVVKSIKEQREAARILSDHPALGFDTEAKPSFRKGVIHPVSLLQLSTDEDAFLIRLTDHHPADEILEILADDAISKIGVAIDDDIKDLRKLRPFEPRGFIALEKFVKQAGIQSNGLRKIAAIALNGRISKGAQVSNWEAKALTNKQKVYAATDAWVGLMVYNTLRDYGYFEHP